MNFDFALTLYSLLGNFHTILAMAKFSVAQSVAPLILKRGWHFLNTWLLRLNMSPWQTVSG